LGGEFKRTLIVLIDENEQIGGLLVVDDGMVVQEGVEIPEGNLLLRIVLLCERSVGGEDFFAVMAVST
jgi:hypothetical protein